MTMAPRALQNTGSNVPTLPNARAPTVGETKSHFAGLLGDNQETDVNRDKGAAVTSGLPRRLESSFAEPKTAVEQNALTGTDWKPDQLVSELGIKEDPASFMPIDQITAADLAVRAAAEANANSPSLTRDDTLVEASSIQDNKEPLVPEIIPQPIADPVTLIPTDKLNSVDRFISAPIKAPADKADVMARDNTTSALNMPESQVSKAHHIDHIAQPQSDAVRVAITVAQAYPGHDRVRPTMVSSGGPASSKMSEPASRLSIDNSALANALPASNAQSQQAGVTIEPSTLARQEHDLGPLQRRVADRDLKSSSGSAVEDAETWPMPSTLRELQNVAVDRPAAHSAFSVIEWGDVTLPLNKEQVLRGMIAAHDFPELARVTAPVSLQSASQLRDNRMVIQLAPEGLGRLEIVLTKTGNDVAIELAAERSDVSAMLRNSLEELEDGLKSAGVVVQQITVQSNPNGGINDAFARSAEPPMGAAAQDEARSGSGDTSRRSDNRREGDSDHQSKIEQAGGNVHRIVPGRRQYFV